MGFSDALMLGSWDAGMLDQKAGESPSLYGQEALLDYIQRILQIERKREGNHVVTRVGLWMGARNNTRVPTPCPKAEAGGRVPGKVTDEVHESADGRIGDWFEKVE